MCIIFYIYIFLCTFNAAKNKSLQKISLAINISPYAHDHPCPNFHDFLGNKFGQVGLPPSPN